MTEQCVPAQDGESKTQKRKSPRRSDPWFKRYPDDFFKGTRALSIEARGAYNDILDLIYMNGGPIPDDDFQIACALRIKQRKWAPIRKELFAKEKLILRPEGISNLRAEEELKQRATVHETYAKRIPERRAERRVLGSSRARREQANRALPNDFNGGGAQRCDMDAPYARARQTSDPDPEKKETAIAVSKEAVAPDGAPDARKRAKPKCALDTRLPSDWVLPEAWRQWAEINFAPDAAAVAAEADRFKDYWIAQPGAKGRKRDWAATWRNWCRNAKGAPATLVRRPVGSPNGESEQLPAWRRERAKRDAAMRRAASIPLDQLEAEVKARGYGLNGGTA